MDCHICLIFTPIDTKYKDALTHYAPPLGLVALANFIHSMDTNVRISILDGSVVYTTDQIIAFIEREKPDFVGQSVQLISYDNALVIAEYAKGVGAKNIFGGHHVTQMAEAIALNQSQIVDYIVCGDGEMSLWKIINNAPGQDIPNLVINDNGKIVRTKPFTIALSECPIIDYSGISLEPYKKLLHESAFDNGVNNITNYLRIYSHKGCSNRFDGGGCVFCGRADTAIRFKSAETFWEEIARVVDLYGADYVFDVGDDFLYDFEWLRKAALIKPYRKENFSLGIFARADRTNEESTKLLSYIGVSDVTIGFESGDERVLANCSKRNTSPKTNIVAAKALFTNNIDVTGSYVLGLPGENVNSLKNTIRQATEIVELSKSITGRIPREMVANLLEPSPGSPIHKKLIKAYPEKYQRKDRISLEELQRDYFRLYFGLDSEPAYIAFRKDLAHAASEIHNLVSFSDSQGWLNSEL